MVRTQIQLTEEQARLLKELALREDVSIAELIRRSIDSYFQASKQPDRTARKARALAIVGKYASGPNDISVTHDQVLAAIYAEVGQ
ncbi:MAG TPA: ribbon-helix-helix protein, CopG family [Caldilineaceae bacterium]|nr:ribbon-helix-helix protein, CopG family [Caldilineaceae bacterium]